MSQDQGKSEEAPGQNKEVNIIVNGREKTFTGKKISFVQIVQLADYDPNKPNTAYTVSFKRGDHQTPSGSMVEGDITPVKEGMIFNVTATDKS